MKKLLDLVFLFICFGHACGIHAQEAESSVKPSSEAQFTAHKANILSYPKLKARWPQPIVPVCWEKLASSTAADRALVETAVRDTWELYSQVDFTGWGACNSTSQGIRIQVADVGPHVKALGRHLNRMKNGMVLNFTFQNWPCTPREYCIRAVAVHEFGHALAFAHEQNRPDTPASCQDAPQGTDGDFLLLPWDLDSVMNYCNPRWNNGGNLSAIDRFAVDYIYPVLPIHLTASSKRAIASPPAGYRNVAYWDVDKGGGNGTYGSTGHWTMAMALQGEGFPTRIDEIELLATRSSAIPPMPAPDSYLVGWWDVDKGGAVGSDGSRGHWNMAMYIRMSPPDTLGRIADMQVLIGNRGSPPPAPEGYRLVGYWDVDPGPNKGTDGGSGHYMAGLYIRLR
jgi:hypothetical protein